MHNQTKKQFIAGAICPKCHSEDSIILHQGENEHISCCRCDFVQHKSEIMPAPTENVHIIQWAKKNK